MRRATAISTVYHRGIPDLPTDCPRLTPFASQAVPIRPYPDRGLVNRGVTKASLLVRPNRRVWGWQQSIPDDKGCSSVVSRDIAIEQPFFLTFAGEERPTMTHLSYPSRTERVLLRLRPDELERAARLARAQEIKVPELIRRILAQAWRASTAADTGDGVWTEQT